MFKTIAALLSNRKTSAKMAALKKTSPVDRFHGRLREQGYTDDEARQVLIEYELADMGLRCEQSYTPARAPTVASWPESWSVPASCNVMVGRPFVTPSWGELFTEIFGPRPPTETVPAFRARHLATGCSEHEVSRSSCRENMRRNNDASRERSYA